MTNTALRAESSNSRTITFKSREHEKFYEEYLKKCGYQDVYHRAFVYCLGIDRDTRNNVNFMTSLSCYEKPTVNHTMRAVRYYLKYCYENAFMKTEMFSKLPNPHYNRQSCLPSSYTANEVTKLLI